MVSGDSHARDGEHRRAAARDEVAEEMDRGVEEEAQLFAVGEG
jgi:hypothetical protein